MFALAVDALYLRTMTILKLIFDESIKSSQSMLLFGMLHVTNITHTQRTQIFFWTVRNQNFLSEPGRRSASKLVSLGLGHGNSEAPLVRWYS